jgi:hypothetical protein
VPGIDFMKLRFGRIFLLSEQIKFHPEITDLKICLT